MSTDPTSQANPAGNEPAIERATYNLHDDRLMFWPARRLTETEYDEAKQIGFAWWPGRKVFTCTWRPWAEDFIERLGGTIEEADTLDDLEERVERFEARAEQAIEEAAATAEYLAERANTQRRRESAAKRVTLTLGKAEHWQRRIAGAIARAAQRESPGVIHRLIQGLEADRRRHVASYTPHTETAGPRVGQPVTMIDGGVHKYFVGPPGRGAHWVTSDDLTAIRRTADRWTDHIDCRLEYERALLAAVGGVPAQGFAIAVGGEVLITMPHGSEVWVPVVRVNRGAGGIVSVTIGPKPQGMWTDRVKYEHIRDYRPPSSEGVKAAKAATKLPPLVNYRGEGFIEMTKADYDRREHRTITVPASQTHGAHRQRETWHPGGGWKRACVFITDAPVRGRPTAEASAAPELDLLEQEVADEIAEAAAAGATPTADATPTVDDIAAQALDAVRRKER